MANVIPQTYKELIERASHYSEYPKPTAEQLLRHMGFEGLALHAQAPLFYVVDYTKSKYLFLDPSSKSVLGYDSQFLANEGPLFFTSHYHPEDFKIFDKRITPQIMQFLKTLRPEESADYSFSYNYRFKTPNGDYIILMQRSTFFLNPCDHTPLAAVGFALDITHFKEDNKVIFTIEKINRQFSTLSKAPLHKEVYLPGKDCDVLSSRELEVLQLIYEGLSSKQIADKLSVSLHTVNNHRKNMLEKTGAKNASDLLHYAQKHGLL